MLLHEQYVKGEWIVVGKWKKSVLELSENLPVDLGENAGNLVIKSVKIISESQVEIVMVTPKSKYDMPHSKLDTYKQALVMLTEYFKQELEIPKGVRVKGILKDNKGRELSTTTK